MLSTVVLQAIRGASVVLFGLSAANGLNITFDNEPNSVVTYLASYGIAGFLALLLVGTTVLIHRRQGRPAMANGGDHIEQTFHGDVIDSEVVGKKYVNQTPLPSLQGDILFRSRQTDGSDYLTKAEMTIGNSNAARSLSLQVAGTCISAFKVEPITDSGGFAMSSSQSWGSSLDPPKPDWNQITIDAPLAHRYSVEVCTEKPEDVGFHAELVPVE